MQSGSAKYLLSGIFLFSGIFILVDSKNHSFFPSQFNSPKKNKLAGDYNGDGKKEIIGDVTNHTDMGCITTVSFSDKNIEPQIDTGTFVSYIINEGDLDGEKGDEFSIYWSSCEAGEWMGGVLYSIRENKWKVHATFSVYGNPDTDDYVTKDPVTPNAVIVKENYWKGDSMATRKEKIELYK